MAIIVPTVTAENPHMYREQYERVKDFAPRVHFDLANGSLAPSQLVAPIQLYWDSGITADIHIMYEEPLAELETLISLRPHMVIVHVEAKGNLLSMMQALQTVGIKAGVALLPETQVADVKELIAVADHALIFSGDFGHFGGEADMDLLTKVTDIQVIKPGIELGWDGGVNVNNAQQLAEAGIDVLNVGGNIQRSDTPEQAFTELTEVIS